MFQLTAARRRLGGVSRFTFLIEIVSTHSRPKAAGSWQDDLSKGFAVSTHSRPKAAGPKGRGTLA